MESNRFWRQLDLCPPDKLKFAITVIGAGAIGSATVVTLAKMGCSNIIVYDGDNSGNGAQSRRRSIGLKLTTSALPLCPVLMTSRCP